MTFSRRFLFFIFLLLSLSAFGQHATIKGVIRDNEGNPLPGAVVRVQGKDIATSTSNNGTFKIDIPSGELLNVIFTFTGMAADTVSLRLNENEVKDLSRKMHFSSKELLNVNVIDQSIRGGSVVTIDPRTIKTIPTLNQSTEDIIKLQAGVSSNNELSSTYSVRGGSYDEKDRKSTRLNSSH